MMYQVTHNDTPGATNADLCVVRALKAKLQNMFPRKFEIGLNNTFAAWGNGSAITSSQLTALLRSAVFKRGLNPSAHPLHSLTGGGANSFYITARDVELVSRAGRWRTKSISAYLWESHQLLAGMRDLMVGNPQTPHRATKRLDIKYGFEQGGRGSLGKMNKRSSIAYNLSLVNK